MALHEIHWNPHTRAMVLVNGKRRDPADGAPAFQWFYSDGTPMSIEHYTDGKLVSEESFPPPTGEA
jgi:hypothetical protein